MQRQKPNWRMHAERMEEESNPILVKMIESPKPPALQAHMATKKYVPIKMLAGKCV